MHSFYLGLQSDACRCATMVTLIISCISSDVVERHHLQSSNTSHRRVAEIKHQDRHPIVVLAGISLTSAGKPHSLNVGGGRHVATSATSSVLTHVSASFACLRRGNVYQPQQLQTTNRKSPTTHSFIHGSRPTFSSYHDRSD